MIYMQPPKLQTLCIGAALLASAFISRADVTGKLWENDLSGNASVIPGGPPDVTFTTPGVSFGSGALYTIGEWLASSGATVLTGSGELGNTLLNTHMQLTGSIFLNTGANNFTVGHDDGLTIDIAGIGNVLSVPGPTAFVSTSFVINAPAAGNYNYTLDYNECCGAPADLLWAYPTGQPVGGAPDAGSTMLLLSMAVTGLAVWRKR